MTILLYQNLLGKIKDAPLGKTVSGELRERKMDIGEVRWVKHKFSRVISEVDIDLLIELGLVMTIFESLLGTLELSI